MAEAASSQVQEQKARCIIYSEGVRCSNDPLGGTDYCGQHGAWFQADLEVFREINEHFRMDVHEYWSRSNFYLLVQGALMSVFVGTVREGGSLTAIARTVAILGLVLCLIWFYVARKSIKWIEKWRAARKFMDQRIDRHARFVVVDKVVGSTSAEDATSYVPCVFAVAWLFLLLFGNHLS